MASDALREEIRSMVRSLLRDLAPDLAAAKTGQAGADPAASDLGERISAAARGGGGEIKIRIASDDDLRAFAALFITCADPVAQAAVLEGKVRLVLDGAASASPGPRPPAAPAKSGGPTLEAGLLNERKVSELAKSHETVIVSQDVVVTPLAYDRARSCGLQIVRKVP